MEQCYKVANFWTTTKSDTPPWAFFIFFKL